MMFFEYSWYFLIASCWFIVFKTRTLFWTYFVVCAASSPIWNVMLVMHLSLRWSPSQPWMLFVGALDILLQLSWSIFWISRGIFGLTSVIFCSLSSILVVSLAIHVWLRWCLISFSYSGCPRFSSKWGSIFGVYFWIFFWPLFCLHFGSFCDPLWRPWGHLRAILGPPWVPLGPSWPLFGSCCGPYEPS